MKMMWQTTLVASLLASGAQAGIGQLIVEGMTRNSPAVERRMQEIAKASILARGYIETRQEMAPDSGVILNADGSINMEAWDQTANNACIESLLQLPQASNPSGTCICYNLPSLNNQTGTFRADLRLFRRGMPTGEFLGIPPENVQVGLSYRGASVSLMSMGRTSRPGAIQGTPPAATPAAAGVAGQGLTTRQTPQFDANETLDLLQTYLFIGQIDRSRMSPDLSM